jgi:hypothetical protein
MGRRIGTEDYWQRWEQPIAQPTGTTDLPTVAANANTAAVSLGERSADRLSRTQQHVAEEQARDTKEGGEMLGKAMGDFSKNYQQGGRYATDMNKSKQELDQGERNAARDIQHGDANAQTAALQNQASLASTQAGTENTIQQTEKSKKTLPIEMKQMEDQARQSALTREQIALENKRLGIQNTSDQDAQAKAGVAALIAQARAKAGPNLEAMDAAGKAEHDRLKASGAYTETQLADGANMGKQRLFNDALVQQSALNSDTKFQEVQKFKSKAAAAADAMSEVKRDLVDYKNNSRLWGRDKPMARAAQERIRAKLHQLGETELLKGVEMGSFQRLFTAGEAFTTEGALEAAVESLSSKLSGALVAEKDRIGANPHLNAQEAQQYLEQVQYLTGQNVQHDPVAKFRPTPAPNPGAGPAVIPAGMPGNPGPTAPPDLRNMRGAIIPTQPQGK